METRAEVDSMGRIEVPAEALYGASTQRAVLNFPVSGYRFEREFLRAIGMVKWAAAKANAELGLLSSHLAELITKAASEVKDGALDSHFPIDIFQTGSGTSTNMNANEVIANRCSQLANEPLGSRKPVDPNNHVNMGQSSNDVIPTVIHVALAEQLRTRLIPELENLHAAFDEKSNEFWEVIKIGRTHLMDATPIRLGQEFSGYTRQCELSVQRAKQAMHEVEELPIGGTAVGTGLNCHPDFPGIVLRHLARLTGNDFREAQNHFEAQAAKDALVQASGHLKTIAVSMTKIANDLRWLASGPRCAIAEIRLPETQPGSSIMPGKVNPVICESVLQVCARVIGNDATITWAGAQLSTFELNVGMPVIAHAVLESTRLLSSVLKVFRERCVDGIRADEERCASLIERSMAMVTSLVPKIGYLAAAEIAKESAATGKTIRDLCLEKKVLGEAELAAILDPVSMTKPGGTGSAGG